MMSNGSPPPPAPPPYLTFGPSNSPQKVEQDPKGNFGKATYKVLAKNLLRCISSEEKNGLAIVTKTHYELV